MSLENIIPWNVYPRPNLIRDSFFCLNGEWDFAVSKESAPKKYDMKITVPFPPESSLSGINRHFPQDRRLFYKKEFSLPDGFNRDRVLLHFGAVDQIASVYLNDRKLGTHEGGYEHFSFDVTPYLKEINTLCVEVVDELDSHRLPYGKQREKRGGMWYTPVTGIWQTVWLESVPTEYIKSIRITTDMTSAVIETAPKLDGEITLKSGQSFVLKNGVVKVTPSDVRNWTPDDPYLYEFTLKTELDEVRSYFALRSLEIKNIGGHPRLCLNEKPLFFHGLLDQGYFMDGIFTPRSPEEYEKEIIRVKEMGFNMLRKHIKIEPDVFYYYCDRLGMTVFQDMVNNGDYSFIRDTALPTVGLKKLNDRFLHKNPAARKAFEDGMYSTVDQLYNFPSICLWTIFNEGWGQFESTKMYRKLKKLDPSRFIDTASGWFKGGESDVISDHVYFKSYKFKSSKKPVILSEFGGYSLKVDGHNFDTQKTYGYKHFNSKQDYNAALSRLYERDVLPFIKSGLCAAVYTQVSDVEDEMNGLFTYDRKIQKADKTTVKNISQKIKQINGEII